MAGCAVESDYENEIENESYENEDYENESASEENENDEDVEELKETGNEIVHDGDDDGEVEI